MADSDPALARSPKRRGAAALPLPPATALVLQGGGALGAYQAGVIEALDEAGIAPGWLAGISIGAINGAIFAGNPPGQRIGRLRDFWHMLTSSLPSLPLPDHPAIREFAHEWAAAYVSLWGVPGFFVPRPIPPVFALPGSMEALSFYDSSPLRRALDEYVDWDRLNNGETRLSVGAVNVETGNFRYFDTACDRIDARHIMASGALPPGLPPIEIDGELWWDGALVSNTPLQHVLGEQNADMLVFQVDLFVSSDTRPRTIDDVWAREKEIRFSSRTRQITDQLLQQRRTGRAIERVLAKLPPELANDRDVARLRAVAVEHAVNIVHLIYRANAWEGGARDYEFSRRTMDEHWAAGRAAVGETIRNGAVLTKNIVDGKSAAFDLTRK